MLISGRNLFHRAIIQSGSLLSSWAVSEDAFYYSRVVAELLNCTTSTTASSSEQQQQQQSSIPGSPDNANMVQCLRRYSADRLANTDAVNRGILRGPDRARATPGYTATFGPTLGGAGVSSIVVGSTATATTLIEEMCGSNGLGGPTALSGIRCDIHLRQMARVI